ncbi:MAG: DUF58 domain-containing protein [Bacillota bacterium]|nr:DUF58 domain-containing protein [Bacillota bacterium]MDP4171625.1 DUF58 domain-containing protein [Bacillota bacterium]
MGMAWTWLKKTWKFIVLMVLIIATFSYAMFQGGFVSWFLFYTFLPFSMYSLALTFYSLGEVEVRRSIAKSEYNAGEELKVDVIVKRKSSFPLFYLIVEDTLSEALAASDKRSQAKMLLFPGMKKELAFSYSMKELPRGEHVFHSFKLKTGDPLGLIEKDKMAKADNKILVFPAVVDVLYQPFENQFDQGMTASRERVQRDSSMAIGVREYQPGDRFSWINWKATAKRDTIMTKEFEQRQSHDVFVVMDCLPDRRFEAIVSFTASFVKAVLKKGAQIGLLTNSGERESFSIRGGEKQLQTLHYHLAKIQPQSSVSLERMVDSESFFMMQSVSAMLITAKLSRDLIEKASALHSKKGSITIFLIKAAKESPTTSELSLKALASARGIRVVLVHEGQFAAAFSEVNLR